MGEGQARRQGPTEKRERPERSHPRRHSVDIHTAWTLIPSTVAARRCEHIRLKSQFEYAQRRSPIGLPRTKHRAQYRGLGNEGEVIIVSPYTPHRFAKPATGRSRMVDVPLHPNMTGG